MGISSKRKNRGRHKEQQAALMLKGQENWSKNTGVYFPLHIGQPGVPKR